ncbi:NAD(P)/FAD-dependent oxidoreductase [Nocardioidaceae bacterium]|nr:NAD(P)/FAD-dependent oxidoreductase [Nocardioidaceae bacterium]
MTIPAAAPFLPDHVSVVVVGAGLSGIGAGYRLQTECPDRDYLILESREAMGGTWDLFRYPGIRSDSDMYTLGYPFKPWTDRQSIADGGSILDYIQETAAEFGIDEKIRYGVQVTGADYSTADARWTLSLRTPTGERTITCDFVYSCAGYYDYEQPHDPELVGLDDFGGQVVHPQFWPEDLDVAGKKVVVIGSGATAVTLVPSLAALGTEHVTMLQRTPSWIAAVPAQDKLANTLMSKLPEKLAYRIVRSKNIAFSIGFYQFCQTRPAAARKLLHAQLRKILGDQKMIDEHFTPPYDPWDQRLCAVPSADLFKALKKGSASIVTDHIDTFTETGVDLVSGESIEADIVVTATGLKLKMFGGMAPSVDGEEVDLSEQFIWNGAMITGVPNFAVCIGYTNASWTLRADLTSRLVAKVLNFMSDRDYAAVVPETDGDMEERPLLELSSGYVQRSIGAFPKQGDSGPWQVRQNYILDAATTMRTDLTEHLAATPRSTGRQPQARQAS